MHVNEGKTRTEEKYQCDSCFSDDEDEVDPVGVLESLHFWQEGHKHADRTGGFVRSHSANVSITTEHTSMS